jgi:molybdopterin/thiamine biosynthesis adenylyltransferase
MPLITWGVITTILPDGISFEEIEFSPSLLKIKMGAALNTVIRCFQVIEMIKLFTGVGEPFFPPNALAPEFDRFKLNLKMNKIKLKLKVKDRRSRY